VAEVVESDLRDASPFNVQNLSLCCSSVSGVGSLVYFVLFVTS
jgi:hypothetical protein